MLAEIKAELTKGTLDDEKPTDEFLDNVAQCELEKELMGEIFSWFIYSLWGKVLTRIETLKEELKSRP